MLLALGVAFHVEAAAAGETTAAPPVGRDVPAAAGPTL